MTVITNNKITGNSQKKVIYASGTLDATNLNEADVVSDLDGCTGLYLQISGFAGGATVSVKADYSEGGAGTFGSKIGFRSIGNLESHIAAPINDISASAGYERVLAAGGSALQIYVSGAGTGTISWFLVAREL